MNQHIKTEVAIIGGGIIGCSTAYYLAQQGRRVIVFEKDPAVGLQGTGRSAGYVRQQGRKKALPLAMESVRLWASLSTELQFDLEYSHRGHLKVAQEEVTAASFEEEMVWEHDQGLTETHMVTAKECREMVPGLALNIITGKLCPTDGRANPMVVTPAFARAAQRLGAEIKTRVAVTGLLQQGSAVRGVVTDAGMEIEAEMVVNAAGPWAHKFNDMVGCPTPIKPRLAQVMVTERQPPRFTALLSIRDYGYGYIFQTNVGNVIIGIISKPTDSYEMRVDYADIGTELVRMCRALPWLKDTSLIRTFSGITDYTPDREPYIGVVPGVDGLFVAAGLSGEGFCTGPMIGKTLAEVIAGGEPPVSLAPWRPDRFAAGETVWSEPTYGVQPPSNKSRAASP